MNYPALITAIATAHEQARAGAAGAVNRHLVLRNWLIGAYLVEFEQRGRDRAAYGAGLLNRRRVHSPELASFFSAIPQARSAKRSLGHDAPRLASGWPSEGRVFTRVSVDLRKREVPGTSPDMLERMRLLYLYYPQIAGRISAPQVRKLSATKQAAAENEISAPAVRKSNSRTPRPLPVDRLLEFSWTHLADLVRLDDPWKRAFYENECLKGNWSKRQLQRQIGSLLYERTGLSTDKTAVIDRARSQARETPAQIADLICCRTISQMSPTSRRKLRPPLRRVRKTIPLAWCMTRGNVLRQF